MEQEIYLAVRKDQGSVIGGGFHYMLHPIELKDEFEAECFQMMGHDVFLVKKSIGERLLKSAREALRHQIEVATLTEQAIAKKEKEHGSN